MSSAPWICEGEPFVQTLRTRLAAGTVVSLSPAERILLTDALRRLLADELQQPIELVTPDARLVETLGADSLTFVEVAAELGEALQVNVNPNRVGRFLVACNVLTVADLAAAIAAIIAAGGQVPDASE